MKKKYNIFPKDIFLGKKPVYLSMVNKGNKNAENQKLTDLLGFNGENREKDYLDVIITFTEKEESNEYLKNIPRIRIHFQ